jgi:hypothetical protein
VAVSFIFPQQRKIFNDIVKQDRGCANLHCATIHTSVRFLGDCL